MLRGTPVYSGGELIDAERSPHRDQERKLMLPLIHFAFREVNVNRIGSETFRAMNCEMLVSLYHAIISLVNSDTHFVWIGEQQWTICSLLKKRRDVWAALANGRFTLGSVGGSYSGRKSADAR